MRGSSDPRHVHVHEPPADGFSHQAPFYADEDSFLAGTVPFVQEAAESGAAVLAALGPEPSVPADDLMAGRIRPRADDMGGRGLWLVNQLCDLVQIRSSANGTTVRVHSPIGTAGA